MRQVAFREVISIQLEKMLKRAIWLAAGLALATPAAHATAISPDLSISGNVAFDTVNSYADPGSGSAGSLQARTGGVDASPAAYTGSTGGSLSGNLTQTGDGFGFSGRASADGSNGTATFKSFIDISLSLSNTSATDTYKIFFDVAFNNAVDADGTDAYADSEFFVRDPAGGADLFFTDLMSDAFFGDEVAGVDTGTFGAALSDSGPDAFFVTLAPGASLSFGPGSNQILWRLEGGAYLSDSSATGSLNAFLSIASVENLTNPNPTPEPATLALLGLGLAGLGLARRRA